MTIGERIRAARLEKGYTLEQLGAMIGVKKSAINKYEKGYVANIPPDKIEALAIALDCTPGYLAGWTDNPIQYTIPGLEGEEEIIPLTGKRAELMQMIREASDEEIDTLLKLAEVAFHRHG